MSPGKGRRPGILIQAGQQEVIHSLIRSWRRTEIGLQYMEKLCGSCFLGGKSEGISENKSVGKFLNYLCFLRTQGSGKVQHCQSALLFKMNEYCLSLNNSKVIMNSLSGVKQGLKSSLARTVSCLYSCKTSWTICKEMVAKVGYCTVLEIRHLKRRILKVQRENFNWICIKVKNQELSTESNQSSGFQQGQWRWIIQLCRITHWVSQNSWARMLMLLVMLSTV